MVDLSKITELGKSSNYKNDYDPSLLVAVPRKKFKQYGIDTWRSWETSWLDSQGKPLIATVIISYSAYSPYIVESKSLKLYLGSLNFTIFTSESQVLTTIMRDVSYIVGSKVIAEFESDSRRSEPNGICIDQEPVTKIYPEPRAALLQCDSNNASETLYTNLFRSCCPVTAQPDWASIVIDYTGPIISRPELLAYLLSYRNHSGFHESCVSEIFNDITIFCKPDKLIVTGYFTRRGGIDINPVRSSHKDVTKNNIYLYRQ